MKTLYFILVSLLLGTVPGVNYFEVANVESALDQNAASSVVSHSIKLCSGLEMDSGRCTGSANCTACSTCNYCAYCNSGGSCGVCSRSNWNRYDQQRNYSTPRYSAKVYYSLTMKTSLRRLPSSQSEVLIRFKTGDKVELIKHYNEWWSKVRYKGKIGYVKRKLLI